MSAATGTHTVKRHEMISWRRRATAPVIGWLSAVTRHHRWSVTVAFVVTFVGLVDNTRAIGCRAMSHIIVTEMLAS